MLRINTFKLEVVNLFPRFYKAEINQTTYSEKNLAVITHKEGVQLSYEV